MGKKEYLNYRNSLKKKIEKRLQNEIGKHWFVDRITNRSISFNLISLDPETKRKEYFPGQGFEVMMDNIEGEDIFISFVGRGLKKEISLEGDLNQIGNPVLFYTGVGNFFSNTDFIDFIKDSIKQNAKNYRENLNLSFVNK